MHTIAIPVARLRQHRGVELGGGEGRRGPQGAVAVRHRRQVEVAEAGGPDGAACEVYGGALSFAAGICCTRSDSP